MIKNKLTRQQKADLAERKRQERQAYIEQLDADIAHLKQQLRRGDK